jgi:hypothetical protein
VQVFPYGSSSAGVYAIKTLLHQALQVSFGEEKRASPEPAWRAGAGLILCLGVGRQSGRGSRQRRLNNPSIHKGCACFPGLCPGRAGRWLALDLWRSGRRGSSPAPGSLSFSPLDLWSCSGESRSSSHDVCTARPRVNSSVCSRTYGTIFSVPVSMNAVGARASIPRTKPARVGVGEENVYIARNRGDAPLAAWCRRRVPCSAPGLLAGMILPEKARN